MKLIKKGFPRELVRSKIERNLDEIEDWESQKWAILRQADTFLHRGKSRRMIAMLLVQKYPYFRDQIDTILLGVDDMNSLEKEMQKYKNRYNADDSKSREKIIAALLRKGFSYTEIKEKMAIKC